MPVNVSGGWRVTLRRWPAQRGSGRKRWAVQWERGGEHRADVYDDEAEARAAYEAAVRERMRDVAEALTFAW